MTTITNTVSVRPMASEQTETTNSALSRGVANTSRNAATVTNTPKRKNERSASGAIKREFRPLRQWDTGDTGVAVRAGDRL